MTTTYDKLDTINDSLNDIKTAVIAKGVTPTGDITTYATAISNITELNNTTLSVTPTTSAQSFTVSSPYTGYSSVDVSAVTSSIDNNIVASNIVSGVSILGVNGSATVLNGETRSVSITSTAGNTFTPSSGKNAITSITVTPTNEARTVNPSTNSQSLTVNSGYSGNGTITVNPVTASIDANIIAGNIKKDVTILNVTGTYEGGNSGKYKLLDRVKTDSNVAIGTVCGFFTDANNVEYAVVCLDAQYRLDAGYYMSSYQTVTNLPTYSNLKSSNVWESKETATFNTQKILDYCAANNYTSLACTHCRSKSFVIGGTRYYGQLPNMVEVNDIGRYYNVIESLDNTSASYTDTNFNSAHDICSSNQRSETGIWALYIGGIVTSTSDKTDDIFVAPILEIPNAL